MWVAWGRILVTTQPSAQKKKLLFQHYPALVHRFKFWMPKEMSAFIHHAWTSSPRIWKKKRRFFAKKNNKSANRPISFKVFFLHHLIKLLPSPPQKNLGKHTFRKIQGAGWIPNEPVLYQCPGNSFQIFQLRHRAWPFFYTPPVFWRRFICDKFEPTKCCSSLLGTLNSNINADSMQFLVRKNRSYVHSHDNKHVIPSFTLK